MTIDQMISLIMSHIGSGRKEVGNYPYPLEGIKAEMSTMRSDLVNQLAQQGALNRQAFAQRLDNLPLEYDKFPISSLPEAEHPAFNITIPKLAMTTDNSAIVYLGPPDMSLNIKTYYTVDGLKTHQYSRVIKNRPYAFVDQAQDYEGDIKVYFFNLGPTPFRLASIHAIFDDPIGVIEDDGFYVDDEEFPAPLSVQQMIIDALVDKYRALYRQYGGQNEPNDQTDKQ